MEQLPGWPAPALGLAEKGPRDQAALSRILLRRLRSGPYLGYLLQVRKATRYLDRPSRPPERVPKSWLLADYDNFTSYYL